jgi:hypothetical protein
MNHDARKPPGRGGGIDGRSEFAAAVRHALTQAVHERVREICLVDPDFEAWPLNDARVLAGLDAWVRLPMRRMLVVAGRFDALPRLFARFTDWRVTWAHAVECRVTDVESSQIPTLLLAGPASLHLADRWRWRGHVLADDREVSDWREVVDVLVQRSEPDFGAATLGL